MGGGATSKARWNENLEVRKKTVPITSFQFQVMRLLSVNRSEDSHLAGGAALHFEPQSLRYSADLDFFHDSEKRVSEAFEEDRKLLESNQYELKIELNQRGYIRALVKKKKDSTKIEWAHDTAWRFMPVRFMEDRGYCLDPIDLAVNKVLALAGRDEPRDYLDVHYIHQNILSLGALCWAACGKDPGFSPTSLLDLIKRRGKYRAEDFERLQLNQKIDLNLIKTDWLKMLKDAEDLLAALPEDEVGCLYYSQQEKKFVTPPSKKRSKEIVPHYGQLKGILPQLIK